MRPLLKKPSLDVGQMKPRIESAVPVIAAGENRSESAADLPGQQRPDAEDTVGVSSVPQQ